MACSIDIQPEFVPSEFCGGVDYPSPLAACNQFGDYLDNETALDELWRVQGEGGEGGERDRGRREGQREEREMFSRKMLAPVIYQTVAL